MLVLPMFQEDGLGAGMRLKQPEKFCAAVAGEAHEADLIFIHPYE